MHILSKNFFLLWRTIIQPGVDEPSRTGEERLHRINVPTNFTTLNGMYQTPISALIKTCRSRQ